MLSRLRYYLTSIPTLLTGIRRWYRLPLLLRDEQLVIELRSGAAFMVRSLMDVWIIKETCLDRDYEQYGTPLEDNWTIVDIGAGLGDFTVFAARRGAKNRIVACEPFPDSFALLEGNLARNGITNVRPLPIAVGARSGDLTLATTGTAVQHSTAAADMDAATLTVPALSLDDLFAREGITQCDFLKMDCEGGEYDILFHAGDDTLARVRHLCLEYHDDVTRYDHTDLVSFLKEKGFKVRTAVNPVHAHLGFLYARRW